MVKSKSLITILCFLTSHVAAQQVNDCKNIRQDHKRLACYDQLFADKSNSTEKKALAREQSKEAQQTNTLVTQQRDKFLLLPHRQSYFMPVSYNSERREINELDQKFNGELTAPPLDDVEVKFQLSFKMPVWHEPLGKNTQLMAAYSQKSFWQMYNSEFSSLFRETNYEPELFLTHQGNVDLFGWQLVNSKLGLVHQSNGRSNSFSRSWNRVYADFVFQKDNLTLSFKPWLRLSEESAKDDNPDIEDYLGRYEIGLLYQWRDSEFTAMVRNISANKHQASYQLSWLYPINQQFNFYLEYFHGYGESLIDYNHKSSTLGLGFTINSWLD